MRPAAVLFDFAGTLLVPEPREQWVAAVCPELGPDEVARFAERLDRAGRAGGPEPEQLPERWAQDYPGRDLSKDLHRSVYEGLLADVTAHDPGLARRLYDRGTSAAGWVPYPDALPVLTALRERGVPVAVVSNVGFDLRPVFAGHGLEPLVDVFVESWELGVMKPAPTLFEAACAGLGIAPRDGLMVGDNPVADGGAAHLGMPVLVLPYSPAGADHGLDAVLQLLG
jgi:putative hydrolase of the HAD superfamily